MSNSIPKLTRSFSSESETHTAECARFPSLTLYKEHNLTNTAFNDVRNAHAHNGSASSIVAKPSLPRVIRPANKRVILVGDIGSGHVRFNEFVEGNPDPPFKHREKASLAKGTGTGHRDDIHEEGLAIVEAELNLMRPFMDKLDERDVRIYYTSALREAIKARGPEYGAMITEKLSAAAGGRQIIEMDGIEEAWRIREAMYDEAERFKEVAIVKNVREAFGALGSGSFQFGDDTRLASMPYGVQPLYTDSNGRIKKAASIFRDHLEEKAVGYKKVNILRVAGSIFRDIVEINKPNIQLPIIVSFKDAEDEFSTLKERMQHKVPSHLNMSDRTRQEVAIGAMVLLESMKHFKIQKLVVSNATIRQSVAKDDNFNNRDEPKPWDAQSRASPAHSGQVSRISTPAPPRRIAAAATP